MYCKKWIGIVLSFILFLSCFPVCAAAEEEEIIMQGVGYVTIDDQCLYSEPSSDSEVLNTASKNDCVVIVEETDDYWYKVIYNLQEGYFYADCLDILKEHPVELGHGRVNSDIVYLRSGPGTEYTILNSGYEDTEYEIIGFYNGWYKILHKKKRQESYATAFVRSDLLDLTEIPYENAASETEPEYFCFGQEIGEMDYEESEQVAAAAPGSYYVPISGNYILAQAQNYIGTPYVFGGYSPEGFDCSGLIYYILTKAGYPSARSAADQYNMGRSVSRNDLKAGDLVFFANTYTSGISHVGVYAGGGKFIHAPGDGSSVCYGKLSGYWSDHYHGARRIG